MDDFWRIFQKFTQVMIMKSISQTIHVEPNGFHTGGHRAVKPYRLAIDLLEMDDVCWMSYKGQKEIHAFEEICWYSRWLMCGRGKVYNHLPELVKRQYGYVQDILIPPTFVCVMGDTQVVQAFLHYYVHAIPQAQWGQQVDVPWQYEDIYMIWYVRYPTLRFCHLLRDLL